ncbi:MAG: cytochrome c biogenesis CcdA family protein [Magnetovibrionaceae bacterium]
MGGFEVGHAGALLAGLASFLSPCVLPLVPPYLCFIAGVSLNEVTSSGTDRAAAWRVRRSAIAFVLGFSTVFIALGATASALGQLVADHLDLLSKIAGGIIILLGLHFLGVIRIGLLFREARFQGPTKPIGLLGAFLIGLAFAFGWTPCVGPVLSVILFTAASEDSIGHGIGLLAAYATGMGIPFLIAAFALQPFMRFMAGFRKHMGLVEKIIGGFLVLTGVLFVTGSISDLAFWLLEAFPVFGRVG